MENNTSLIKIGLRYQAIFLNVNRENINMHSFLTEPVVAFCSELAKVGYSVNEELLHALTLVSNDELIRISKVIDEVYNVYLNWTPLVKHWDVPTGETRCDHIITFFANIFGLNENNCPGVTLPCGHFIPEGTFPIERYNGCPFCGTPFETNNFVYKGQGSKLRELRLFTEDDMVETMKNLLESPVPLDATQMDTLNVLIRNYSLPDNIKISIKENLVAVVKLLVQENMAENAASLFKSPVDIMRYLWFCKTGLYQIVEPKTLINIAYRSNANLLRFGSRSHEAKSEKREELKLKYTRSECRMVAKWINSLNLSPEKCCELMNPKREMWVRFIRALRLGEFSRKHGYEHLKEILDVFYKKNYKTWSGRLNSAIKENDVDEMFKILKERPGSFARNLFSIMLRYGTDRTVSEFAEVAHNIPLRLIISLINNADYYFDKNNKRIVRSISGYQKVITKNPLISKKTHKELEDMILAINKIFEVVIRRKFTMEKVEFGKNRIYIDDALMNIPIAVGDRSTTIQDTSCALMGTRFALEGNNVRLFMQWGKGLHSQHLDMDLSCRTVYDDGVIDCTFYNLSTTGCQHSGDIQYIPEMVGTAEYIDIDLDELNKANAKYVIFTCNAYTNGNIAPNLVVGWMNSANPMEISENTGVAYDPSCVQHMVKISESNLSKGLVFGVLDVSTREIIWLEMPFMGQLAKAINFYDVKLMLDKLSMKMTIGKMLMIKAEVQSLTLVNDPDLADEKYTYEWALQPENVSGLLLS